MPTASDSDADLPDPLTLLWPRPRRVDPAPGAWSTRPGVDPDLATHRDRTLAPGAYRLVVSPAGARATAADEAGERAAAATWAQLARLSPTGAGGSRRVPACTIDDAPAFQRRGVLLDVSRGRVPRVAELERVGANLAAWKFDHLQLYLEHAFAYAGHEDVWRDASPLTPDEVRAFDTFCAARGIELAPNQQSFGHFHRWLKHRRYRDLAEVPTGVSHAFSLDVEPYSLDLSDPGAIALLEDLYDQLLPCFRSRTFGVGLDETFDLGTGRSRAAVLERGVERVYLEHLLRVHALVTARGRRMQFFGDVILKRPELVPELPRDLTALAWGYDAGHPFDLELAQFARAGLPFWVCPGTSSWQSFTGRVTNALANQREAARAGQRAGAAGYMVTDWGDRGHHQPSFVRDWGLFAAAGAAWNPAAELDPTRLAGLLDAHVFLDDAGELGRAAIELASTADATGSPATNGSALFFLLAFALDEFPHPRTPDLTRAGLERAQDLVESARSRLARSRSRRADAQTLRAEFEWAACAARFGARLGLARLDAGPGVSLAGLPTEARRRLAAELRELEALHEHAWLSRDRPGGLDESLRWLRRVREPLETQ